MRLKTLFTSMIATLALAGCSSEDGPIMGSENTDDGYGYVAVNIVEPKSVGSRANDSNKFEDGTPDENKAETGLFFIYNQDGTTMYNNPQVVNLTNGDAAGSGTPYVEKIYKAVLVIDGVKDQPTTPLQIICVLNAPSELASLPVTTPLSTLKGQIDNYGAHTAGAFIMSNSVYKDGTNDVCGAIVTESNLKNSASAALAAPVDIYVERVVARIQANTASSFTNDGAKPTVDGMEKALTIKVTGIEVANIAQKSYLLKDINNIDYTWTWNDPTNKRSYWETVPATTGDNALTFGNKSYTNIATDPNFDITKVTDFKEYVQPNTTSNQKTAILVTAQLMDGDAPADLAYIRGGYTTKEKAKDIVATYLQTKGYYKTGNGDVDYTSIKPADLDWVNNGDFEDDNDKITWLERYEVVAQIASTFTGTLYKKSGNTYTVITADVINKDLKEAENYAARVFTDGKCYYYVNIDQTPVANDNGYEGKDKFEGVIRNHIYNLTLNSISGIGTPVFDPDDVIIPETPGDETLWYLGARVNVLKWRLVGQTVDFTGK